MPLQLAVEARHCRPELEELARLDVAVGPERAQASRGEALGRPAGTPRVPFAPGLDRVGPLARTVTDTALLLSVLGARLRLATATAEPPEEPGPDEARRHGAGKGRRWPALLALVLALAVIAALVVWGLLR